jgi:hypothetical protein
MEGFMGLNLRWSSRIRPAFSVLALLFSGFEASARCFFATLRSQLNTLVLRVFSLKPYVFDLDKISIREEFHALFNFLRPAMLRGNFAFSTRHFSYLSNSLPVQKEVSLG